MSVLPGTDAYDEFFFIPILEQRGFQRNWSWLAFYDEAIVNAEAAAKPDFTHHIFKGDLFLEALSVLSITMGKCIDICLSEEIIAVFICSQAVKIV